MTGEVFVCLQGDIESDKLLETAKEKLEKSDGEEDTKETEQEPPVVVRRREKKKRSSPRGSGELPPGWEKHEDDEGAYFWHVKSGTIQREPPQSSDGTGVDDAAAVVRDVR